MSSDNSVSHWIEQLQAGGDAEAAERLWERYFRRLVGLARTRLQRQPRGAADEEDVALSAFHSFCHGAEKGRFPQLLDRDSLWRLLVTLTERKASHQTRDERRLKRGGGAVLGESALHDSSDGSAQGLAQVPDPEPTPEFAALVADECRLLLTRLEDADLQTIAVWRMEGYTAPEIAQRLNCA